MGLEPTTTGITIWGFDCPLHHQSKEEGMTRNEIIRMAREAGFLCDEDWVTYGLPGFERFAALVAAHEREECAKVCDERATADGWEGCYADQCAAAIRSRT